MQYGAARADRDGLLPGFAPNIRQIHSFRRERHGGRENPDVLKQPRQFRLRLSGPAHEVERFGVVLEPPAQAFQAGVRALQGIAAFMSDHHDEFADGRQALAPERLKLRLFEVGDVVADGQDRV